MEINANHPIKMTRLAMRALLGANKKGVVCLVSSGAGLSGFYLASLYCASKAAVVGFAKSMGMADQEEGVKVVCICPG
jgi:NAD(P)-dependent dehydrogenase (short-subunit alcohol dehydrogenase family)